MTDNNIKWPENNKQVKSKSLLQVLLLVLILVSVLAGYVFYGMNHTPYSEEVSEEVEMSEESQTEITLSAEEKMQKLESLEKNINNLSEEEKYDRLNSL